MSHDNDLKLAKRVLAGDEREFNVFFEEFFPRVYRFALTRLEANEDAARDIAQSTLVNAMRGLSKYRGEASMFTWLCQICRNEINGHYRRLSRSVPTVSQDDDAIREILESIEASVGDDPDTRYQGTQITRIIQETLDSLPSNYGNALEWKYIDGFSVTEIAARLGVTELAAQSLLARARGAFRSALTRLSPHLASQGA